MQSVLLFGPEHVVTYCPCRTVLFTLFVISSLIFLNPSFNFNEEIELGIEKEKVSAALVVEKEVKSCLFSFKILDLSLFLVCTHSCCLGA